MPPLHAFIAFPDRPAELGATLDAACNQSEDSNLVILHSWRENDVPGRFIAEPILQRIDESDFLVADITRLNFNVTFEIGYAIGKGRRVVLIVNRGLISDGTLVPTVGIFDTIGYQEYANSEELFAHLSTIDPTRAIHVDPTLINIKAPVYVVLPRVKGDAEIRLTSRIKKARLNYRSYDPEEEGRMSAPRAIADTASSHGIIIPLMSENRTDAFVHNIRAAFVSGLATAMDKELLLLQAGADPVPIDYRDLVESYTSFYGLDALVADYAPRVAERMQLYQEPAPSGANPLTEVSFGASAAENELRELGRYYLRSDDFYKCRRGEIQVIAGRKGSGKTALFLQLRDELRRFHENVVLDLKPEGFQLMKLKDEVLNLLEEGTRSHTVTAFWEYLLLIEICHKVLKDDERTHMTNHVLFQPYRDLASTYLLRADVGEGDFAERMTSLIDAITERLERTTNAEGHLVGLSAPEITELIHSHSLPEVSAVLMEYLEHKEAVWILFDNLDKGWPPHGLGEDDLLILRCLVDALAKIERLMRKNEIDFKGVVFIRNDVYELLVASSPDRGKVAHALLDWQDQEALRELMRKRLEFSGVGKGSAFEEAWRLVFASHVEGEESSQYLIDRSLMRPRALIDLATSCKSHAVNRGHARIEVDDIRAGEAAYSNETVNNIAFELQDVFPRGGNLLYAFLEAASVLAESEVIARLGERLKEESNSLHGLDLLLWYGVLGIARGKEEARFIYDMGYSMVKMEAYIDRYRAEGELKYAVNKAFWAGLEIEPKDA